MVWPGAFTVSAPLRLFQLPCGRLIAVLRPPTAEIVVLPVWLEKALRLMVLGMENWPDSKRSEASSLCVSKALYGIVELAPLVREELFNVYVPPTGFST